jgi:hypothetical protein
MTRAAHQRLNSSFSFQLHYLSTRRRIEEWNSSQRDGPSINWDRTGVRTVPRWPSAVALHRRGILRAVFTAAQFVGALNSWESFRQPGYSREFKPPLDQIASNAKPLGLARRRG